MTNQRYRPIRASAPFDLHSGESSQSAMLLNEATAPGIGQCLGVATIPAGSPATGQLAHSTSEVMFVAEGRGQLLTSEGNIEFHRGDAIFIPADLRHALNNTGETMLVSVFSFPASDRPSDSEEPH